MARNYKREYRLYHSSETQKKRRAERNAARRKMEKAGKVRKGDGKDVAHKKPLSKGGSNSDGLKVEPKSKNRSFRRGKKNQMLSETSRRERRKK